MLKYWSVLMKFFFVILSVIITDILIFQRGAVKFKLKTFFFKVCDLIKCSGNIVLAQTTTYLAAVNCVELVCVIRTKKRNGLTFSLSSGKNKIRWHKIKILGTNEVRSKYLLGIKSI